MLLSGKQLLVSGNVRRASGLAQPAVVVRGSPAFTQQPMPTAWTGHAVAPAVAPLRGSRVRSVQVRAAAPKDKEVKYDVSVKVEELSVCSRRATITVPASAVKDVFKRGVKRIERDVVGQLRGWQEGKPLPLSMVITQVGGQAKFKTFCLEELLLDALPKGMEAASGGRPVDAASVTIPPSDFPSMLERYDPGREFTFTATFDVAPPLAWRRPIKDITITIQDTGDFTTDAAAADDLLRQYRKQHGFSRVAAGRGLQLGDTLVMDLEVRSKATGVTLPGLKHSRFSFDTEKDVLGITQSMLGMKTGESRTFEMVMPQEYQVEFWQGKPVKVSVTVHEIFEWTLPEFDDAYVAKHHAGKWGSAKEMREALIASTAMQRVQELDKQLEDAVVKAVVDALDMPEVPPRMVEQLGERQFQAALLQMIEDRIGSREDVEQLATEEMVAEYISTRRKELEDMVRFNLAVDDIFADHGLTLEEEAVQAEYDLRVRQMEAVEQPFDRQELLDDVRETVKSVTVIEWLKDNIKREVLPYDHAGSQGPKEAVAA